MTTQLLRELITFGALGSLAEELTDKPAEELLSAETYTQIDALMTANEPFDRLASTAELLTLLDESAARILALIMEGGDADVETDN
jgi:hypothetical protein